MEEKNAVISSARIYIEDHGFLTATVYLDYGHSAQGFGGYALDNEFAAIFIRKVMETVGVDDWEELPGKTLRVKSDMSHVQAIGHIIKDVWFNPEEAIKEKEI